MAVKLKNAEKPVNSVKKRSAQKSACKKLSNVVLS